MVLELESVEVKFELNQFRLAVQEAFGVQGAKTAEYCKVGESSHHTCHTRVPINRLQRVVL